MNEQLGEKEQESRGAKGKSGMIKRVLGLTHSLQQAGCLGLQHNVAMTVITLSVRKS